MLLLHGSHTGTEKDDEPGRIPETPLYFELQDKKGAYNKEAWQKMRQGKAEGTTEAEYAKIIEDVLQTRITIDQLELEYVRKYKQFLSAKKIYQIQKAEMKFHRELLKNTQKRK